MSGTRAAVRALAWTMALLLGASARAGAADDAGTRSIFASGAGSRALALGGAYSALGGGLAGTERIAIEVTHTGYYDLGLEESFGAVALPSWRWGVAGLSVHHLGITGIERRDDQNVVVDPGLTSSETEITLAYGRRVGDAFALGGGVKLQRQTLAGLSGSGLGADLGLTLRPCVALKRGAPWAQRLAWGLSARNVIEPSLRLDQDWVPDPLTVRSGLAYEQPVSTRATLRGALDVEKPRDGGARLHGGIEIDLRGLIALRGGINQGHLTAGSSVGVRGLSVDYVFEDRGVDAVHRIGLSHAFGATVVERRQASLAAEERAIQGRLDTAFQKREADQLESLLAGAEARRAAGDLDGALDQLALLATLAPGNDRGAALEARCQLDRGTRLERSGDPLGAAVAYGRALELAPRDSLAAAGLGRCRLESGRREARSANLKLQFAAALDALGADDLIHPHPGGRSEGLDGRRDAGTHAAGDRPPRRGRAGHDSRRRARGR